MNRPRRFLFFFLLALLALVPLQSAAADAAEIDRPLYLSAERQVVVPRPDGSTFTALLHYPALAGNPAPLDPAGAPYPAIVFGHGYLQRADQYAGIYAHLAARGYLVIAPESGGELFPSHADFAADLSLSVDLLEALSGEPASWLAGGLNPERTGMSGHSMGGGAALLAAADDPRVDVVAPLAPAETFPSVIDRMSDISARVTLIAGSDDLITPLPIHALPMFQGADPPRRLAIVQGGSHCGFQDVPFPLCDSGALDPAEQMTLTRRLLTDLFGLYLQEQTALWPRVWGPPALATPQVTLIADPGMRMTPRTQVGSGGAGTVVTYSLTLRNTSAVPADFTIATLARWPTTTVPSQSGPLAPGESIALLVTVQVPAGGAASDRAVVSARSAADPLTRQFAILRTERP